MLSERIQGVKCLILEMENESGPSHCNILTGGRKGGKMALACQLGGEVLEWLNRVAC